MAPTTCTCNSALGRRVRNVAKSGATGGWLLVGSMLIITAPGIRYIEVKTCRCAALWHTLYPLKAMSIIGGYRQVGECTILYSGLAGKLLCRFTSHKLTNFVKMRL